MAEYRVATVNLKSSGSVLCNISSELSEICEELQSAGNLSGLLLDGKDLLQMHINSLINTVCDHSVKMEKLGDSLSQIANLYDCAERNILCKVDTVELKRILSAATPAHNTAPYYNSTTDKKNENTDPQKLWEYQTKLFEHIFKALGKIVDNQDMKGLSSILGYIRALFGFGKADKSGWAGMASFCDLADSSTKLWSGIYSMSKAMLDADSAKAFSKMFGKAVSGVAIFGSLFSMLGSICDTFGDEETTWGKWPAGIMDIFKEGSGLVKNAYEFKNYANLANLPKRIHSTAGMYAIVAETTFSSASQMIKSIDKYSADGNWSWTDTAMTGIDSSVEGLESLISGLTFGLVSADTFGTTTGEISTALKEGAGSIGTEIGEYICDHPDLKEKYQNGSIFDQIGITIEAGFKSLFA